MHAKQYIRRRSCCSNFLISLDLPLINCKIELDFSWSKECIIFEILIMPRVPGNPDADPPDQDVHTIKTTRAAFQINNAKLYVPVVTFPINNDIKFLEIINQDFKRTISWSKYRSEITTQPKSYNLINLKFRKISRLFVLSFKNSNGAPARNCFDELHAISGNQRF